MRRILAVLSLLLIAAAPPPRIYSVADFGAVADGRTPCDDAVAAALAKMRADDTPGQADRPCRLVFPPGDFVVRKPIVLDRNRIEVVGAGQNLTTLALLGVPTNCAPVLVAGVPAPPAGVTFDPAARKVDLLGVLDAKAAPRAGVRWGLKTDPNWHVGLWAGPAAHGSNGWADAKVLTVAFALDNGGTPAAVGPLFGMEAADQGPGPWRVRVSRPGEYGLDVATLGPDGKPARATWLVPGGTANLDRVVLQLDIEAGTVLAWINGKRAKVFPNPALPALPGRRLEANDRAPFLIGGRGRVLPSYGPPSRPPRTFCGLRVSDTAVYQDADTLTRLDGTPVDDLSTFFSTATASPAVFFLPLTDGPAAGTTVTYHQVLPAWPGRLDCWGLWFSGGFTPHGGFSCRDMTIRGGQRWGQGICLGSIYNTDLRDLNVTGGWHGIGSMPFTVSYPVDLRDVTCQGQDAGYYGYLQIVHADRLSVPYAGRTALRFEGCRVSLRGLWIGSQDTGEFMIACHAGGAGGGQYLLDDVQMDNEGPRFPSRAVVMCEAGTFLPQRVTLRDWDLGSVGPDAVLLMLRDNGLVQPWHKEARVTAERIAVAGQRPWKAVVQTDGPNDVSIWKGVVERPAGIHPETPDLIHLGPGKSGVKVISP